MKFSLELLVAGALSVCACAPTKTEKPKEDVKKPRLEGPKLVGRIASIPADKRFVLIQKYDDWEKEIGGILTTHGPDERTANLRITGESLGEFAAADLQSGSVEVGDAVYSPQTGNLVTPTKAPALHKIEENQPLGEIRENN